ncbi:MAG: fasciclin domain-containing protein [Myxococcota bacterium]
MKFKTALTLTAFLVGCAGNKSSDEGPGGGSAPASQPAASAPAAAGGDIVDVAVGAGFNTLAAALKAGGLVGALKGPGPFTVFAPTDAAFEKLPAGTLDSLLKPENKDQLVGILTYHVVEGKVPAKQVMDLSSASTLSGNKVSVAVRDGKVVLNDAAVVTQADVKASNGIIHVIDTVLLPE